MKDANVRTHLQEIGRSVDEQLPEGWGFILLAFPFGDADGRCNYLANCTREDGVKVVSAWLAKQRNPENFGKHI